ncbi:hypothetical protein [Roseovarius pacificus]|uniref:hypothetical protein n=1 Tax=Roseovarius pacificus TaxID=337701 RepID=UPI001160DFCD|nr:hypothetical protein [Roseovarius pacificus]
MAAFAFFWRAMDFFLNGPIEWGEIWLVPLAALFAGLEAAWSIPSSMWNWAKFEHPWWAVCIGFVFVLFAKGSRS